MNNYIFSVISGACVFEIVLDFLPLSQNSGVKKYVKYIFSLVLALCICSPFVGALKNDIMGFATVLPSDYQGYEIPEYIYFEDTAAYKCTQSGIPDYSVKQPLDMYLRECFSGIVNNAKSAVSEKFQIELSRISIGIAFDASNTEGINIICANIGIDGANSYLKSDVRQYLNDLLKTKVGGLS